MFFFFDEYLSFLVTGSAIEVRSSKSTQHLKEPLQQFGQKAEKPDETVVITAGSYLRGITAGAKS
jgi:hypothetical protein